MPYDVHPKYSKLPKYVHLEESTHSHSQSLARLPIWQKNLLLKQNYVTSTQKWELRQLCSINKDENGAKRSIFRKKIIVHPVKVCTQQQNKNRYDLNKFKNLYFLRLSFKPPLKKNIYVVGYESCEIA